MTFRILVILALSVLPVSMALAGPPKSALKFVVISDIHVRQPLKKAPVPPAVHALIKQIVKLKPRFVAVTGDFTNGAKKDIYSDGTVDRWWLNAQKIIQPIRDAGIPVLPVPGNHDLAKEKHQQAYLRAWKDLAGWTRPLKPAGNLPMYYSTDIDGVHLSMLNFAVKEHSPEMLSWLKKDLASARGARARLIFGHMPMRSAISWRAGPRGVFKELSRVMIDGGATAYFAGHEHLIWDETFSIDKDSTRTLRQVISGVAGAKYRYALHSRLFRKHCNKETRWCVWPNNGRHFRLTRKHRRVPHAISFIVGRVQGSKLTIVPHVLAEGRVVAYPTSPQPIRPPLPTGTRRVLILGDSHMKGTFGYLMHKALHNRGKFDILSFGIGGAGTLSYSSRVMRDWCCGYRVRRSWPRGPSGKAFKHEVVEQAIKRTRKPIGRVYGGSLKKVLRAFKPEAVIIILGGNVSNRHQRLFDILKADAPEVALLWVGPFKRKYYRSRYKEIRRVLKANRWGALIRSDDILGDESWTTAHFGRTKAWLWANTVAGRMDPILKIHFQSLDKKP